MTADPSMASPKLLRIYQHELQFDALREGICRLAQQPMVAAMVRTVLA